MIHHQLTIDSVILERPDKSETKTVWKRSKRAKMFTLERPSWNRGGGLRYYLSPTYNAVLRVLSLRACSSPPVSENWRRLLDERWNCFKKLKQAQLPTIQHLELPWRGWLKTLSNIVTRFNYWSCSLYAVRSEGYHLSIEQLDLTIASVNVMKLYFRQY